MTVLLIRLTHLTLYNEHNTTYSTLDSSHIEYSPQNAVSDRLSPYRQRATTFPTMYLHCRCALPISPSTLRHRRLSPPVTVLWVLDRGCVLWGCPIRSRLSPNDSQSEDHSGRLLVVFTHKSSNSACGIRFLLLEEGRTNETSQFFKN